jgi:hypothetical protein
MVKRPGEFRKTEIELVETLSPSELTSFEVSERIKIFDPLTSTVAGPKFDVYLSSRNVQFRVLIHFFEHFDLLSTYQISIGTLLHFLNAVERQYNRVPFHDWNHAVATTQFIFYELVCGQIPFLDKLDILALLVAGICHDIGHKGHATILNPQAQMALGFLYKDQPVMETFHCSTTINVVSQPNCNILGGISDKLLGDFWSRFIDCVLATDMAQHKRILEEAEGKVGNEASKLLVMKLLVKCATNGALAKHLDMEGPWAPMLVEEGLESSVGELGAFRTATQANDSIAIAKRMVAFIGQTCIPMFRTLGRMVPTLHGLGDQVMANLSVWQAHAQTGK